MAKKHTTLIAVLVSLVGCSIVAVCMSLWQASLLESEPAVSIKAWANGCFVAGVIWGSLGILTLVARMDGFSALQYLFHTMKCKWNKAHNENAPNLESYYDYLKNKKRNTNRPLRTLLIPAAVYLAAAAVLSVCYVRVA